MFEKKMTKADLLAKAKLLCDEAITNESEWRKEAAEDFAFRDGEQWTKEEKSILQEEHRPALTFNLTKASVDLVMGLNEDGRVRYRCTPVEPNDEFLCEVLNNIVYWLYEQNEWDDEEDDVFESAAICGRGWIGIDFGPDPNKYGEIKIDQKSVSIFEVARDGASRRRDLGDSSFVCWEKWLTVEDFNVKYPKAKINLDETLDLGYFSMGANLATTVQNVFEPDPILQDELADYDKGLDTNWYDKANRQVRVIHMEYWQSYKRYFVMNPKSKEIIEVDTDITKWSDFKKQFKLDYPNVEMNYTTMSDKRVKWLQFIGHEILFDDVSPMPYKGYSVVPCFAYTDVSKRTNNHFGIVRLMKDAQKEVNKRWSQTLNLINNQVQPGIYAESTAFMDKDQAEISLKEPGSITYLADGAITKKRLQERTIPTFPSATMQMEEHAQTMLRRITGINPDLLGMDRGRQEPGVVVRLRQQQGMVILKPLFKAYKRMKKELFKRQLAIIMKFMPISQMQRILGNNYILTEQGDALLVTNPDNTLVADIRNWRDVDYNVDAEEVSASMTKRMFELTTLNEMQTSGFPVDPITVIEKMDLSVTEKQRWIQYVQQQQQMAAQAQEAELNLKVMDMRLKHEREMLKIRLEHGIQDRKVEAQVAKDANKHITDSMKNQAAVLDSMLDYDADIKKLGVTSDVEEKKLEAQKIIAKEQKKGEAKNVSNSKAGKKSGK